MINGKRPKQKKHYKKNKFNEFILNFIEGFKGKKVNKRRKRKRHKTIAREVALAAQENIKDKKTLSEFQREKPVKPVYLNDEKKKENINELLKLVDEKDNVNAIKEKFTQIKGSFNIDLKDDAIVNDDIDLLSAHNKHEVSIKDIDDLTLEEKEILNKIKSSGHELKRDQRESRKEVENNSVNHVHHTKSIDVQHKKYKVKNKKEKSIKVKSYLKYKNIDFDLRLKSLIIMCLCGSGFVLFYLIPFIISIYYSLINNAFDKRFVWLSNYIEVVQNQYFRLALKNTFQFTFIGVGILIPISFIFSVIIVNLSKSMSFVKPAFFIPMLLPTASVIIIWKILFGDYSYIYAFLHSNTGRIPIYLLFLWKNCGYNIILFSAAFLSVDKYIYEAASLDGVNMFQKHLFITFPLILPTVFFIFIISLVNSFKIFKEVYLFYGTSYPEQNLYLVQHYMKNHFDKLNYQNLTTGAIIFAIIVYIIVAIGYKIQAKVASEAWY